LPGIYEIAWCAVQDDVQRDFYRNGRVLMGATPTLRLSGAMQAFVKDGRRYRPEDVPLSFPMDYIGVSLILSLSA
jgi:hypothetical protein